MFVSCGSCAATSGTFSNNSLAEACSLCTNKPAANAYYLKPRVGGFNASSNDCPWDCNAGYVKSGAGCVLCSAGVSYRTAVSNAVMEGSVNTCLTCLQCTPGVNYQTTLCTPTVNRVCSACSTACPAGSYQSSPCNITANRVCTACRTSCPAGMFRTVEACTGNTNFDEFYAGCRPCLLPGECGDGRYLSKACTGTDTTPNRCVACSVVPPTGDCLPGQFRGGCANYTDTRCINYTRCDAGSYLVGESINKDGECRICTNCGAIGLTILRNCTTYNDAVCMGGLCTSDIPCVTPAHLQNMSRLFCDYSLSLMGFCGVCPSGYSSDGQACLECPRGKTCNQLGEVQCNGQCPAGIRSSCVADLSQGAVYCRQSCAIRPPGTDGRWVRRGSHVGASLENCETYFQCGAGYYKMFRSTGVVECEACTRTLQPLERWVSGGLSVGNSESCLWDCKRELAYWNGLVCVQLVGRSQLTGMNPSGWWLEPLSKTTAQCPTGRTSEQGAAIRAAECIACHALPNGASWIAGSTQCEWSCINLDGQGQMKARGGACIRISQVCSSMRGFTSDCQATSFPWNRGGYVKTGWQRTRLLTYVHPLSTGYEKQLQSDLTLRSFPWQHNLSSPPYPEIPIPGPLCSGFRVWIGPHEFVLGAVCEQSFLVYLNLSSPSQGLRVLIGSDRPGWRDGFRTQALFESELYVVGSPTRNDTLFVLDTWNCLLREVVVYGLPGGYLTRAYTVWGITTRLSMAVPEPRCYGTGGLARPRRFWRLMGGWLAFADDNGLWQFHPESRALLLMLKETDADFEADELVNVSAADEFLVRLEFQRLESNSKRVWVWELQAKQAPCPVDYTSLPGGDCTVDCPSLSIALVPARFVNLTRDGECMRCQQPDCGYGQQLSPCSPYQDASCVPCPARADLGVYSIRGTCEDSAWRTGLPPCGAGFYAADGGRYCEKCPSLTATWRPGATDVRQCKCVEGLVRRGGLCVAQALYEFETACAAPGTCGLPLNARLLSRDLVGCSYECLPGFYHRVGAGWMDKCSPCLRIDNRTLFTRGDDDEPWSCE